MAQHKKLYSKKLFTKSSRPVWRLNLLFDSTPDADIFKLSLYFCYVSEPHCAPVPVFNIQFNM